MSRNSYRNKKSIEKRIRAEGGDDYFNRSARREFREKQIRLLGNLCPICQKKFDGKRRRPTVDHIIPVSKGGPDIEENWQLMCDKCNTKKGNRI